MEEQKSGIFRKAAIDKISSPEQLSDYLKVTGPGVWIILAIVIIMLIALIAWSTVGELETVVDGVAIVKGGTAEITVNETESAKLEKGMSVRIGGDDYIINNVDTDEFGRSLAYASTDKPNGRYEVKIVTDSVHPITFLFD